MNQTITTKDVINTVIAFSGNRPLSRDVHLQPFGSVDLTCVIATAGPGLLYVDRYAYVGQPLAINLVEETPYGYEPFADITKCHPPANIAEDEVMVKTYAENYPLRDVLLAGGLFEDTGRRSDLGFCELEVWRLTPAFVAAFAAKNLRAIEITREALQPA